MLLREVVVFAAGDVDVGATALFEFAAKHLAEKPGSAGDGDTMLGPVEHDVLTDSVGVDRSFDADA
jgi:hypothetical protein